MTSPTSTHPATWDAAPAYDVLAVETVQAVLVGALHALSLELVVLRQLATATKTRSRGFMTGEARRLQDEMIRREKAEYARRRDEDRALPIPPNPLPKGGASPAPAKVPALDLLAQVHHSLLNAATEAHRRLGLADRVLLATLAARDVSTSSSTPQVAAHLLDLAERVTDLPWLSTTLTATEKTTATVRRFIHGEATAKLDALCPWCDQKSLTVFHDQGVIICGRHHDTGTYAPCVCSFRDCPCKTQWHRHSWNQPEKGEWRKLLGLIREADHRRDREAHERATARRAAAHRFALAIISGQPATNDQDGETA